MLVNPLPEQGEAFKKGVMDRLRILPITGGFFLSGAIPNPA